MADNIETFDDEETPQVYNYPSNFQNTGRIFGGKIETKKLIEAAIFGGIIGFIEYIFLAGADMIKMIAIMVITVGPIVILGITGISGDSLSEWISKVINFLKNRRKLRYRRIKKDAKTSTSRAKSKPTSSKKKPSR